MKNLLLIVLLLASPLSTIAQDRDREEHRERIQAMKTAHITDGMDFSPEEAQKFWPIYNSFQEKRRALYRREHAEIEKLECMTEREADEKLKEYVELERKDYLLKEKYFTDLRNIFSAKKIMRLKQLEEEFNRILIREYRSKRNKNEK